MSKRLGNIVEPMPLLDTHGADALRWCLFTAAPAGEPRRFSDRLVQQTLRQVLLTLWNVYSFFTNYASIDAFEPAQIPPDWRPEAELDRWILSELNQLVQVVDGHLEAYNPTDAGRRIQEFIDNLSNWYVRRSRRRFWKSENDADKLGAYAALYRCLTTLAKLMAPLAPFVSEQMYRNLELPYAANAPDSVHLADYPAADAALIDRPLMDATRLAMRVASMGRAARSKAGLKVRQPLAAVAVRTRSDQEWQYLEQVRPQILEELNIKELQPLAVGRDIYARAQAAAGDASDAVVSVSGYSAALEAGYMVAVDAGITPELADEGLAREISHRIQNLRKSARFAITDRIVTYYAGPETVARVMAAHGDYIRQETLSDAIIAELSDTSERSETARIEGMDVTLAVSRAAAAP